MTKKAILFGLALPLLFVACKSKTEGGDVASPEKGNAAIDGQGETPAAGGIAEGAE
jgi:hypothetical protein